jgi:hypothetical protein
MAASDNLSPRQFSGLMPTGEVGKLESQFPGMSMRAAYQAHGERFNPSADDRAKFLGHGDARQYQQDLNDHIAKTGIQNPIAIGKAYSRRFDAGVINGQHRYFAARDLGLSHVPVEPHRIRPVPEVPGWNYDK